MFLFGNQKTSKKKQKDRTPKKTVTSYTEHVGENSQSDPFDFLPVGVKLQHTKIPAFPVETPVEQSSAPSSNEARIVGRCDAEIWAEEKSPAEGGSQGAKTTKIGFMMNNSRHSGDMWGYNGINEDSSYMFILCHWISPEIWRWCVWILVISSWYGPFKWGSLCKWLWATLFSHKSITTPAE